MDPWLPIGYRLDGLEVGPVLHAGEGWQIVTTSKGRCLLATEDLASSWADLVPEGAFAPFTFGMHKLVCLQSTDQHALAPVTTRKQPLTKSDALSFAMALARTRTANPNAVLGGAIFAERIGCLLPVPGGEAVPDSLVLGTWLAGGLALDVSAPTLSRVLPGLTSTQLVDVIAAAGLKSQSIEHAPQVGPFSLPGRPALTAFFTEHVLDIVANRERYRALGIGNPGAMILHGPPGCGKTFAVDRLIEHLSWPSFRIEAGSVASPYIHETSRKVAEVFAEAIDAAPSVLVIDEMEAFLADREMGTGHHRVEEVAEFLRRIPEAVEAGVLIVAMTNRIEMIDPAIRRRGRFDHIVAVDPAGEEEVEEMLSALLNRLPTEALDLAHLAKNLAGRPLSDVAFVVREAARLAARAGRACIRQADLATALVSAPARDEAEPKQQIGFRLNR